MLSATTRHPIIGSLVFGAVSWTCAALYVYRNDGFGAGDLESFGFWSLLALVGVYPILIGFRRVSSDRRPTVSYLIGAAIGTMIAVVWTAAVWLILGPWIMAFSFPVFLCWTLGALAGTACVVLSRHPRSWLYALLAVALPFGAVVGTIYALQPGDPPPGLILDVSLDATHAEIESIWSDVLSEPTEMGGKRTLSGIRSVSRTGDTEIRLQFHRGVTLERRDEIKDIVLQSPSVAGVRSLDPGGD